VFAFCLSTEKISSGSTLAGFGANKSGDERWRAHAGAGRRTAWQSMGSVILLAEHRPKSHQAHLEWTPPRLVH